MWLSIVLKVLGCIIILGGCIVLFLSSYMGIEPILSLIISFVAFLFGSILIMVSFPAASTIPVDPPLPLTQSGSTVYLPPYSPERRIDDVHLVTSQEPSSDIQFRRLPIYNGTIDGEFTEIPLADRPPSYKSVDITSLGRVNLDVQEP